MAMTIIEDGLTLKKLQTILKTRDTSTIKAIGITLQDNAADRNDIYIGALTTEDFLNHKLEQCGDWVIRIAGVKWLDPNAYLIDILKPVDMEDDIAYDWMGIEFDDLYIDYFE